MSMDVERSVEGLPDNEVLAAFGTAEGADGRGFDEEVKGRVLAHEFIRARGRLAYFRTLYATFAAEGQRYMIENLDDDDTAGRTAKVTFSNDDSHAQELLTDDTVVVWTEQELLDALRMELLLHDYFADLLDELAPA